MARGKKRGGKKKGSASASTNKGEPKAPESKVDLEALRGNAQALNDEQIRVATVRAVTGVLASEPEARDIKFDSFSLSVGGNQLVTDCRLELNQGCRYGLVGTNGCGKSNVLSSLAQHDLPMPEFMDLYHLHEECLLLC